MYYIDTSKSRDGDNGRLRFSGSCFLFPISRVAEIFIEVCTREAIRLANEMFVFIDVRLDWVWEEVSWICAVAMRLWLSRFGRNVELL